MVLVEQYVILAFVIHSQEVSGTGKQHPGRSGKFTIRTIQQYAWCAKGISKWTANQQYIKLEWASLLNIHHLPKSSPFHAIHLLTTVAVFRLSAVQPLLGIPRNHFSILQQRECYHSGPRTCRSSCTDCAIWRCPFLPLLLWFVLLFLLVVVPVTSWRSSTFLSSSFARLSSGSFVTYMTRAGGPSKIPLVSKLGSMNESSGRRRDILVWFFANHLKVTPLQDLLLLLMLLRLVRDLEPTNHIQILRHVALPFLFSAGSGITTSCRRWGATAVNLASRGSKGPSWVVPSSRGVSSVVVVVVVVVQRRTNTTKWRFGWLLSTRMDNDWFVATLRDTGRF
jgi:hypothetical protein